jgi:hypothetical protein
MLTIILTVLSALGSSLSPFIGSSLATLISASVSAIAALAAAFTSGGSITTEASAAITALQAEAQAVAADTSASPAQITAAEGILSICGYFLAGVEAAQDGTDPSTLPIPPAVS